MFKIIKEKEEISYDNTSKKKCPKCGKIYTDYPALSRRDNKTYICPRCGQKEAIEDFLKDRNKNESLILKENEEDNRIFNKFLDTANTCAEYEDYYGYYEEEWQNLSDEEKVNAYFDYSDNYEISDVCEELGIKTYNGMLELSDRSVIQDIGGFYNSEDAANYGSEVERALTDFGNSIGTEVYQDGRSGRHIVIELNKENVLNFDKFQEQYKEFENKFINNYKHIGSVEESLILKEWYDENICGGCGADISSDNDVHIIDGIPYCGNCWSEIEDKTNENNIMSDEYFGDNIFEESLILKEANRLKIENPRVENNLVKMKVNGKEYAYKHNTMSAQELLDKYNSIAKHSEGRAFAWLKAHSNLVKESKKLEDYKRAKELYDAGKFKEAAKEVEELDINDTLKNLSKDPDGDIFAEFINDVLNDRVEDRLKESKRKKSLKENYQDQLNKYKDSEELEEFKEDNYESIMDMFMEVIEEATEEEVDFDDLDLYDPDNDICDLIAIDMYNDNLKSTDYYVKIYNEIYP